MKNNQLVEKIDMEVTAISTIMESLAKNIIEFGKTTLEGMEETPMTRRAINSTTDRLFEVFISKAIKPAVEARRKLHEE